MKTTTSRPSIQGRVAPEAERPLSPTRAFVVQFREERAGAANRFMGRVEHMITGRAARFESADELLAFFAQDLSAVQTKLSEEG